jgi:hypothetical protein
MISITINVSKINKEYLYEGKQGKYLNIVLFPTENDQYGNDYKAVQGLTKEQRAAGLKGPILGNGKNVGTARKPTSGGEDVL